MNRQRTQGSVSAAREEQWETLHSLIRDLEEERDLRGLAKVAETSLASLRQLCERPVTCEELNEMLERVRALKLDAFEIEEDQ